MLDLVTSWQSAWDDLPLDTDGSKWADNLANYLDAQVSGKLQLDPMTIFDSGSFSFNKGTFSGLIKSLPPSPDPTAPRAAMASAWMNAILASSFSPGSADFLMPVPSPATMFASIAVAPNPAAIASAYNTLLSDLLSAPLASVTYAQSLVKGGTSSQMPVAFRKAFASIGFIVSGINKLPPPAGPLPLMAMVGVV